jgi:phosphoglycolate phosphatase-like HAD superfamily hydrolase
MNRESAALEARLKVVNRELSLAREFLAAEARDLEALGRIAAERLSIPPSRCVVFEDAPAGITAAKAAGMRCIAITSKGHTVERQREAGAQRALDGKDDDRSHGTRVWLKSAS